MATNLIARYEDEPVLRDVSFQIEPGEKVALIGRNGSGKTTVLRLAAGRLEPDGGSIERAHWARVGYLPQMPEVPSGVTVTAHVRAGAAVHALETRLRALEHLMADPAVHDAPERLAGVMDEYGRVHHQFDHIGGFTLESRASMALSGLGFSTEMRSRPLETLSGGWRARAELARVLLTEPDLLLLDEPTNHLDLDATEWLEEYLEEFPGAAVIVSHDRYLLDAVTSRTLELEDARVTSYPGAYSAYAQLKTQQVGRTRELYERQQEEIAKLQAYIRRYKAGNRATQARSREKMLARVEATLLQPPREPGVMRVPIPEAAASGRFVARLAGAGKRYNGREVLHGISLEIYRGERIGLLGRNGSGKSTLLKMLAGLEVPTSGQVALGVNVRPRYFAQESTDMLNPKNTVLDEVLADRPLTPERVRTYLGRFLFSGDDVFKRVAMLSGGERQRLGLATLLLDQPNLLLLDEPTNHLDIPSREALEGALLEFSGTMIVATHDRYLLERLATRILTVDNQQVGDFRGTYHELRDRQATAKPARVKGKPPARTAARVRAAPPQRAPSFEELASQIADAERLRDDAARVLADPESYRDPERVKAARAQYEDVDARLTALYEALGLVEKAGRDDG